MSLRIVRGLTSRRSASSEPVQSRGCRLDLPAGVEPAEFGDLPPRFPAGDGGRAARQHPADVVPAAEVGQVVVGVIGQRSAVQPAAASRCGEKQAATSPPSQAPRNAATTFGQNCRPTSRSISATASGPGRPRR